MAKRKYKTTLILFFHIKVILIYLVFGISSVHANTEQNISQDLILLKNYIQRYKQGLEIETRNDSTYFYLIKAKELATAIGQDSLLAEIKGAYAFFIRDRGKIKEAWQILHENARYARNKKDSFLLMRTYMSMGNNHFPFIEKDTAQLDSLIFYCKKGLQIAEQRKDILHLIIVKQNLAEHYKNKPHLKAQAKKILLETIDLTDQHPQGIYFKAPAFRDLAKFYLESENYEKAIEYLEKSIEFGKAYDSYGSLLMAYQDLQKVYEKIGNYKKSLEVFKSVNFYHEKINNGEIEKKIAALEVEFETERKANEINQLQLLNEQEKERSHRQQILLIILLVATLLIGGLAYLAFRNNQKKQQALLQLSASQKEIANFKTRFYTNLTHEFRTPLTVIQGMANRLLGNPESKEMILRNSQSLLDLVNKMLDLQKLDSGVMETNYVQSDIVSYLRYLTEPFTVLAKYKNIQFTVYDEKESLLMDFDVIHVRYILNNLLSNAIKFTPIEGTILLHLKAIDNHFQIKVKDNGIGIDPAYLDAIFDRFYQTPTTHQHLSTGTGIGLALVKELVDLMKGKIQVESKLEEGTTFTVFLPIRNTAELLNVNHLKMNQNLPILDRQSAKASFKPIIENSPKILVIEDNPDVLRFLELSLQGKYELTAARDGQAGLNQALETIPDLIISDIIMPIMDGLELCKQLKNDEKTSHIPIVLLTAKTSKVNQLEGFGQGADAYLTKPFEPQELLIRIDKLLENRRKLQAYYLQWNPFNPDQVPTNKNKESIFLLKVKDIVEEQLGDENFGVLQLCHSLHLSRMQVHRKLKAVCDKSTAQFIREMRLQKAYQLLKSTDLTVAEVAYAVGFADPNYFSKVFSEFFGFSPSVTRK